MPVVEWGARGTAITLMAASAVSDDGYKTGTATTHEIDNETNQHKHGSIEFDFGADQDLSSNDAPHILLFWILKDDNGNWATPGSNSTSAIPPASHFGSIGFEKATNQRRNVLHNVEVPNHDALVGIQNKTGGALPATGWTLEFIPYDTEVN